MQTTIKRSSAPRKDDLVIILATNDKQVPKNLFTSAELSYIRKERKEEKKLIAVNQYKRMIFIQMLDGSTSSKHLENSRKAGSTLAARVLASKQDTLVISSITDPEHTLAFAEGLALSTYQFLRYKSNRKKEQNALKTIGIFNPQVSDREISLLQILVKAVSQTRDLVNEPVSFLNASELSRQFTRMGKEAGFTVEVLEKEAIQELKMGGLLSVNLGSIDPPTFTIMEWKPENAVNKRPIVLIGKGVVYDTGGYSLKPTPNSMDYMKCDMAGGAAVAGAIYAVAQAKLPVHVIALVPATDNRVDGNAYVPGDVITMMSGKTVEVLNTDAEGRLILADALHYAKRYKPELVMEFSTLTGAASTAVGAYGIVCMGKVSDDVKANLNAAGEKVYERLAEFPFWEEYDDLLRSDIADLKNIGGPTAGAITAGRFLLQFTDYPYMHFDIAGPAFLKSNDSYRGRNGTGVGVRLLFEYLKERSKIISINFKQGIKPVFIRREKMSNEQEGAIRIGISIGELNGVGAEVIMKTFSDTRMLQVCTPVIYGSSKAISFHRKALNVQDFNYNTARSVKEIIPRKINLLNCWEEEIKIEIGVPSKLTGSYALKALESATNDLKSGEIDALVTAPIDKNTIQPENYKFTGHTEYLAAAFNAPDHLMFLVSGNLRVALVTGHVPVSQVSGLINKENILRKLAVMNQSLKRDFGIRKPRIAVLGLNPHAGDQGVIGNEDQEIIIPAVKEATTQGILAYGPYAADGIFGAGLYKKFDAILAMYHDQGLIPFKTLAFETGVNFTAGLPFVRTSPDHGTAYDIAGKGIASESSFREAVYLACDIFYKRREFDGITANPLPFAKLGGDR